VEYQQPGRRGRDGRRRDVNADVTGRPREWRHTVFGHVVLSSNLRAALRFGLCARSGRQLSVNLRSTSWQVSSTDRRDYYYYHYHHYYYTTTTTTTTIAYR